MDRHGWMDEWMDGWMMDGWMDTYMYFPSKPQRKPGAGLEQRRS